MWLFQVIVVTLTVSYVTANKTMASYSEITDDMQTLALNNIERKCCSGVSYEIEPNPNYECCGTLLYDHTSQSCCNGTIHESKPNFKCCGPDYYNVNLGLCCPAYYLGVNTSVNFPTEIASDEDAKKNAKCCGIRVYDSRNQICCQKKRRALQALRQFPIYAISKGVYFTSRFDVGAQFAMHGAYELMHYYSRNIRYIPIYRINSKKFTNTVCCNGDAVDGDVEKDCVEQKLSARFFNRAGFQSYYGYNERSRYDDYDRAAAGYCEKTKFDLAKQLCCTIEIKNESDQTKLLSKIHSKTTPTTYCCGLGTYDFDTEICCNNKTHKQNGVGSMGCCGDKVFDESKENCTVRPPFPRNSWDLYYGSYRIKTNYDQCCGNQTYNESDNTLLCCQSFNPLTLTFETLLHKNVDNPKRTLQCCGLNLYDLNRDTCCGTKIYPRLTHPNSCCGNAIYNPEMHVCCNDTVYEINRDEFSCCGFSLYSRDGQFCCNGKVFSYTEGERGLSCCRQKQLYDFREQICCDNVLNYSKGIAKRQSCC